MDMIYVGVDSEPLRKELDALAEHLRSQIKALDAEGASSNQNAQKINRNEFWVECADLFEAIAPRPLARRELARLLIDCSPFETSDGAVRNFVDRRRVSNEH
jgi:hypothetical protein